MAEGRSFRIARKEDLPAILDLYRRGLDGMALGPDEAEAMFERFRLYPDYHIHVAEKDDRIEGTFSLMIMDNLGHCGTPLGILEDVVVDPDLHGQGIGRAMMEHALDICRDRGCYKLMLSSHLGRRDAHAFYEALGFEKHGYSFMVELRSPGEESDQ